MNIRTLLAVAILFSGSVHAAMHYQTTVLPAEVTFVTMNDCGYVGGTIYGKDGPSSTACLWNPMTGLKKLDDVPRFGQSVTTDFLDMNNEEAVVVAHYGRTPWTFRCLLENGELVPAPASGYGWSIDEKGDIYGYNFVWKRSGEYTLVSNEEKDHQPDPIDRTTEMVKVFTGAKQVFLHESAYNGPIFGTVQQWDSKWQAIMIREGKIFLIYTGNEDSSVSITNEFGQALGVAGGRAVLWDWEQQMYDLNDLIDLREDFTLVAPQAINRAGQILCVAVNRKSEQYQTMYVLLTPDG